MILDSLNAIPGCLPGQYRGIAINVLDTSSEVGRRVLEYLFPGVDQAAYDDFGLLPAAIDVEAFILADDYRAQAKRLQTVFETPGTGLLIHPWLGPMTVIMEEPARISFSSRELRMVRISARFKRVAPSIGSISLGGFASLLSAIANVVSAASALAASVASVALTLSIASSVRRSRRVITAAAAAVQPARGTSEAVTAIRSALAASAPEAPADLDSWVVASVAPLQAVQEVAAVAPAAIEMTATNAQGLMTIGLLMAEALTIEAAEAPATTDTVLLLTAATQFWAASAVQVPYADYASSQEAITFRSTYAKRAARLVEQLEDIGTSTYQAETSDLIRSLASSSAEIVSYLNEVIGELPAIQTYRTSSPVDAWSLAQHIAGDDPSRIEEVYADIVARNDPRHPSYIDKTRIEVRELT